jgi:hypothetical protein
MKTVFEHIRDHALQEAGCMDRRVMPDLAMLQETEWNPRFERLMRNRLIMGALRYGSLTGDKLGRWNYVQYLQTKLDDYRATGNLEDLVDIGNLALLEFTDPTHPAAHWGPIDDTDTHCPER